MKIIILVILVLLFLPFYVYILSKCTTLGKINTIKQFFKKESTNEKKSK